MVCPDNKLIGGLKDQVKPIAQDRQKVFNLAVPKKDWSRLSGNISVSNFKFNFTLALSFIDSCCFFGNLPKQLHT